MCTSERDFFLVLSLYSGGFELKNKGSEEPLLSMTKSHGENYFTAPAVIPLTICFESAKNKQSNGSDANTAAGNSCVGSTE